MRIIRELLEFKPSNKSTNIAEALKFLSNVIKKKAIVFVLSDYMDEGYGNTLKILAGKHDITGIRVYDNKESSIPNLGLVHMRDEESGELVVVDTSSQKVRKGYSNYYNTSVNYFKEVFTKSGAGSIDCSVEESYVKKLLGYFKRRA